MPQHKIETEYVRAEFKHPRRWPKRNERRLALLSKKLDGTLTDEELDELDELTVELNMMQAVLSLPAEEHTLRGMTRLEYQHECLQRLTK